MACLRVVPFACALSLSACWVSHERGSVGSLDAAVVADAALDASTSDCREPPRIEIGTTSTGSGVVAFVDDRTVRVTLDDGSAATFQWFPGELPAVIAVGREVELSVDGNWSRLRVVHSTQSLVAYASQGRAAPDLVRLVLPESMQTLTLAERCTAPSDFDDRCEPRRIFDADVTQRVGRGVRIGASESAPSGCDEGTLTFQGSVEVPPCTFTTVDPPEAHTDLGGLSLAFGYSCMFYE